MAEDPERLLWQLIFRHSVEMAHGGLSCPANIQAAVHVGLRPVKNTAQFVPIGYFLERHALYGSAGNDEPVEAIGADLVPRAIERDYVIRGCVARDMVGDL